MEYERRQTLELVAVRVVHLLRFNYYPGTHAAHVRVCFFLTRTILCCIQSSTKTSTKHQLPTQMLRLVPVLLLLVGTACAKKCLPYKATPTAGMCKGYTIDGAMCLPIIETSDQYSQNTVLLFNSIEQDQCQQNIDQNPSFCTDLGGKFRQEMCKMGGLYCQISTLSRCTTDAQCADGVVLFRCCSSIRHQINLFCTGVDNSLVEAYISQAKMRMSANSNQEACRDTDCIDWNSASSLNTTPILLPVMVLLAIITSFFGQR